MRAHYLIAALAVVSSLSACGGGGSAGDSQAGPPEWFLRGQERQQMAAARASAVASAAGAQRFAVATDQAPSVYRERMAGLIERCWVDGEPGWRVERGPGAQELSLLKVARQGEAAPMEAIRLTMRKASGPGLEISAAGPLAARDQRGRLRRALERAKSFDPQAPSCPSFTDS